MHAAEIISFTYDAVGKGKFKVEPLVARNPITPKVAGHWGLPPVISIYL